MRFLSEKESSVMTLRSACFAFLLLFASQLTQLTAQEPVLAQARARRLTGPILETKRHALPGSRVPFAKPSEDQGELPPDTRLTGSTLVFNRTPEQQGDLEALLAAQQDPASPHFRQWLTPEQFGERFGLGSADLDLVEVWLRSHGLTVDRVSPSRDRLHFSGTAAQAAAAFGSSLHRYRTGTSSHFAPGGDLSLPSALAPLITAVLGLSDLQPEPSLQPLRAHPEFTAAQTGRHLLDPVDVATQYDMNGAYAAGLDGTGQSITVVGQSWLPAQDLGGLSVVIGKGRNNSFIPVLVPNTGVAAAYPGSGAEASLDIEYSGLIAPGANLFFVYTGDSGTAGAFDALAYAVEQNIGSIISLSFGSCELAHSAAQIASLLQVTQQANAQGQTITAASGDRGGTECYGSSALTAAQQSSAIVQFPSDLPTVTAVGGLQLAPGTFDAANTQYFSAPPAYADSYNTLRSYVPEVIWNEDGLTSGIASGGGGASTTVPRPAWQSGVLGIPPGAFRLVPDVALQASIQSPGFLFCTSDTSLWASGQTSSCTLPGVPDELTNTYSIAGGTSFGAPILAGMLAVLGEAKQLSGQGNINPVLYGLAANSGTYASVFHDIVTGTNQCTAATGACPTAGQAGYGATAGYDLVSGLGSVDFAQLLAAWPASPIAANLTSSYINVFPSDDNPAAGSTQTLNIGVIGKPYMLSNQPTGSVSVSLDGQVLQSTLPITANGATLTYTAPGTIGSHIITVSYPGDRTHTPSRASTAIMIGSAQATGTFQLSATAISLPYNGTATSTVTITPASGYNGVVRLSVQGITLTSSSANSLTFCYRTSSASTYAGAATANITLGQGSACTAPPPTGAVMLPVQPGRGTRAVSKRIPSRSPLPAALATLLVGTLFLRRPRRLPSLCAVLLSLSFSLSLVGCGGGGSSSSAPTPVAPPPAAVTFTVTLSGQDSVKTGITSATTFAGTVGQ